MLTVGKLVTCEKKEKEENGVKVVKYSNVGLIIDEKRGEDGKFIPGSGRVISVLVGKKYDGEASLDKCLNQRFYVSIETFKGDDGELNMLTYLGKTCPVSLE